MNDWEIRKSGASVRWMIRRDLPSVLAIEAKSFEFPWSEEAFLRSLSRRNCIGLVAEAGEELVGYVIYELERVRLHVLNLAIQPEARRSGVGTLLISHLVSKLSPTRRRRIGLEVRETNLAAQLFFRSLGFRATSLLRGFYEDTPEDAYVMQYRHPMTADRLAS